MLIINRISRWYLWQRIYAELLFSAVISSSSLLHLTSNGLYWIKVYGLQHGSWAILLEQVTRNLLWWVLYNYVGCALNIFVDTALLIPDLTAPFLLHPGLSFKRFPSSHSLLFILHWTVCIALYSPESLAVELLKMRRYSPSRFETRSQRLWRKSRLWHASI